MIFSHDTSRPLPQSPDAERCVLSAYMIRPRDVGALCAEKAITAGHFFTPANADIFRVLMQMWLENHEIDLMTATQRLRDKSMLDQCGGAAAVTEIFTHLPTAANARYHLEILSEKHTLREMIKVCAEYGARCYDEQDDVPALLDGLSSGVTAVAAPAKAQTMTLRQALADKLHRMQHGEPMHEYVWTGLAGLDKQSPMRLGEMPLISGERKAGKSILALSIARHVAKTSGPVLYFSLEDPISKVTDRLVAAESAVPMARDRIERLIEGDMGRLERSMRDLKSIPLVVRDDCYDLSALVAVSRQQKASTPDLKLIVVDYGQLVRAVVPKGANREQEVALVSRTLRLLSMELSIVMMVLVQLNTDGNTRESKAWEQDCTAMWKLVMLKEDDEERNSARVLTVPFQRNGESGIGFKVAFLGHIARVETYAEKEP